MKRIVALAIAAAMALSLVACGNNNTPSNNNPSPSTSNPAPSTPDVSTPGSSDPTPPASPYLVQFVGATSGGTFFLVMNGFAQLVNDKLPDWFKGSAQSTAGGLEILRLLENGDADFGIGQAGVALSAIEGTYGEGNQPKFTNISSVTYMYPQVMQVMASNSSDITDFTQFAGQSFCAGAAGSATEVNTQDMYAACGIEYSNQMQYTSETQSVELMKNNQAVGGNYMGPLGSAAMTELYSTGNYHLVPFTDEQLDAILAIDPSYYRFIIPAGTYANQDEDIQTFAVANFTFARTDMDEDAVYMFTKMLYENIEDTRALHSVLVDNFALENCISGMTVPLHPGAERYYKEVGAIK